MRRLATLLLVVAGLQAAIAAVDAQGPTVTVSIDSLSLRVGEEGSVVLQVGGYPEPGLGGFRIRVTYDPLILEATHCRAEVGACVREQAEGTVRLSSAGSGLLGDFTLASVTFRCRNEGTSALTLDVELLGSAIPEDPIPEVEPRNGALSCTPHQPTPSVEAGATARPPGRLPDTGMGGASERAPLTWPLLWALATVGGLSAGWAGLRACALLFRLRVARPGTNGGPGEGGVA